jgi:hypothetical protein
LSSLFVYYHILSQLLELLLIIWCSNRAASFGCVTAPVPLMFVPFFV